MSQRVEKLTALILEKHDQDFLDEHIHQQKSEEATSINNEGPEAQVRYLLQQGGEEWIKSVFDVELPEEDIPDYLRIK